MQGAVPVRDDDTPETLAARVIQIEHRIYPEALRLLASGKMHLAGDICRTSATAVSGGSLISPVARAAGA
jgi:phosphoribosylglycinamide formyltransferase-1